MDGPRRCGRIAGCRALNLPQGPCARLFAAAEAFRRATLSAIDGSPLFYFDAFSRRPPALAPHQARGGPSLENASIEPALMAQAYHFLDKDRLLLVVEAGE